MSTVITAGNATDGMSLSADTTGQLEFKTGIGAGTTAMLIDNAQIVTFNGGIQRPLLSGTAVASTSGTSVDFTGIPSWAKRITVMFNGLSTNGTSTVLVQLGTASSIEVTGYLGGGNGVALTTGLALVIQPAAANTYFGSLVISQINATTNTWVSTGAFSNSQNGNSFVETGSKSLAEVLTRLRITTFNGTDTFDAGSINILYE
jgi:hypothetical protein